MAFLQTPPATTSAEICRDKDGRPEPDSELCDTEGVPLTESVEALFEIMQMLGEVTESR